MAKHTYETVVGSHSLYGHSLEVHVISDIYTPPSTLYTITLTDVTPCEWDLDAGRFSHYTKEPQAVVVSFVVNSSITSWFEERLTWIAANVHNDWSFSCEMPHVSKSDFSWSFADANDAILFKLSF